VLASSAVDRGFNPKSGQTKNYEIVVSPLTTHHDGVSAKTGWLGIRITCPSGAACLHAGCCFSVHDKNTNKHVGIKRT
jgi:hypothetical protein